MAKFSILLACGGFALAAPMAAGALVQDETADEEADPTASTEIICRRVPPPTGTRIGARRICKTRYEWALIDREVNDIMENAGNRSRAGNAGAGFCTKRTC